MPTSTSGLPLFVDRHGPLIALLFERGLRPDQIRRRFHLLHPEESPAMLNQLLARMAPPYSLQEATDMATYYTDAQVQVGVELAVFKISDLTHNFDAAHFLDESTFIAVDRLTSAYDPSGESARRLLGAIAAVRQAVADGQKFRLDPEVYEQVRQQLGGVVGLEDTPAWPVPSTEVACRMGNGLWHHAVRSMGLDSSSGAHSTVAYGQVAVEIRDLHDPGIGLIPPRIPADQIPESVWDDLRDLLAEDLTALPWRSQMVVKYLTGGIGNAPSAWASAGPDGISCAMATAVTVPVSHWPLDIAYFDEGHWEEPTSWDRPWTAGPLDPVTAAERMVDGLRFGRLCSDPYNFRWGATSPTDLDSDQHSDGDVIPLQQQKHKG